MKRFANSGNTDSLIFFYLVSKPIYFFYFFLLFLYLFTEIKIVLFITSNCNLNIITMIEQILYNCNYRYIYTFDLCLFFFCKL